MIDCSSCAYYNYAGESYGAYCGHQESVKLAVGRGEQVGCIFARSAAGPCKPDGLLWKPIIKVMPPGTLNELPSSTTAALLRSAAATFEKRNAVYGDNYRMVGPIMAILLADSKTLEQINKAIDQVMQEQKVPLDLVTRPQFHLLELIIVKITRFAVSQMLHIDSIHDTSVYAAMIESILRKDE